MNTVRCIHKYLQYCFYECVTMFLTYATLYHCIVIDIQQQFCLDVLHGESCFHKKLEASCRCGSS